MNAKLIWEILTRRALVSYADILPLSARMHKRDYRKTTFPTAPKHHYLKVTFYQTFTLF